MECSGGVEGDVVVEGVPHPRRGGLGDQDSEHVTVPVTSQQIIRAALTNATLAHHKHNGDNILKLSTLIVSDFCS